MVYPTEHHHTHIHNIQQQNSTYPSSPQLTYDMITDYIKTEGLSPTTRNPTGHNSRKTEPAFAQTNIRTANIIFTNIILMADKHNIPKGKMHNKILHTPPPHISSYEEILPRITRRTLAQLRTNKSPFLNHIYTRSMPNHIHHHYAPSVTPTHTHVFNCTTLSPLDLWTDPTRVTALLAR